MPQQIVVNFGTFSTYKAIYTIKVSVIIVNSKFLRICKKCLKELNQRLTQSRFPQAFHYNFEFTDAKFLL